MSRKIDFKQILTTLLVGFFAFQILSLILANFFEPFRGIVRSFQLIWMFAFLGIIVYFIFRLVHGLKDFDKTSIFVMIVSIALLTFIIVYFNLDFGKLFEMSVVRSELGSVGKFLGSLVNP